MHTYAQSSPGNEPSWLKMQKLHEAAEKAKNPIKQDYSLPVSIGITLGVIILLVSIFSIVILKRKH
jgi:hypothetical protein